MGLHGTMGRVEQETGIGYDTPNADSSAELTLLRRMVESRLICFSIVSLSWLVLTEFKTGEARTTIYTIYIFLCLLRVVKEKRIYRKQLPYAVVNNVTFLPTVFVQLSASEARIIVVTRSALE